MENEEPVVGALEGLRESIDALRRQAIAVKEAMAKEVGETKHLKGVVGLGGNAISVPSSLLFAGNAWSQFRVDAPRQAQRIGELIDGLIVCPGQTAQRVENILNQGREGNDFVYAPEVVERFRPILSAALDVAQVLQGISVEPEQRGCRP